MHGHMNVKGGEKKKVLICDRYKSGSQLDIRRLLTFTVLRNDVCRARVFI